MYRHLGGRILLLASGASGLVEVTSTAAQPRAVDAALTLLAMPFLVEAVVALGLLALVVSLRTGRRVAALRHGRQARATATIRSLR